MNQSDQFKKEIIKTVFSIWFASRSEGLTYSNSRWLTQTEIFKIERGGVIENNETIFTYDIMDICVSRILKLFYFNNQDKNERKEVREKIREYVHQSVIEQNYMEHIADKIVKNFNPDIFKTFELLLDFEEYHTSIDTVFLKELSGFIKNNNSQMFLELISQALNNTFIKDNGQKTASNNNDIKTTADQKKAYVKLPVIIVYMWNFYKTNNTFKESISDEFIDQYIINNSFFFNRYKKTTIKLLEFLIDIKDTHWAIIEKNKEFIKSGLNLSAPDISNLFFKLFENKIEPIDCFPSVKINHSRVVELIFDYQIFVSKLKTEKVPDEKCAAIVNCFHGEIQSKYMSDGTYFAMGQASWQNFIYTQFYNFKTQKQVDILEQETAKFNGDIIELQKDILNNKQLIDNIKNSKNSIETKKDIVFFHQKWSEHKSMQQLVSSKIVDENQQNTPSNQEKKPRVKI